MWTRSLLKKNAWNSLKEKGYYWSAFGVMLLAELLGGAQSSGSLDLSECSTAMEDLVTLYTKQGESSSDAFMTALLTMGVILVIVVPIAFAVYAFLSGPISVGKCTFFLKAREGDVRFDNLFSHFKSGRYMPTVKIMFVRYLYTTLWSLLLLIPGIIKGYEYYLIPYLLSENPNLPKDRAFAISKQAMKGEKWDLFVLELSFIGWYLLGLLACCVGAFFVPPYEQATYTEFYACMRAKIIAQGISTEEELTGGMGGSMGYGEVYGEITTSQNPYDAK